MKISMLALSLLLTLAISVTSNTANSDHSSIQKNLIVCLTNNSLASPVETLIYTPASPSFTSVLDSYIRNLRYNTFTTKKPLLILTPTHASHIQSAILCAKKHGVELKVRSGGHDFEGLSYWSTVPFFMVDMFNLRSVDVNIEEEIAWVEVGATLGELYYAIANKSKIHAYPGGVCPTVGVGGHITGGGYGTLLRKYGLTVDNVVDAIIVDVNGKVLDRKGMGEDLFWAIRGGGGSSFCVIVSYKIKLVQVPETVTVFRVARTLEENLIGVMEQYQNIAPAIDRDAFVRLNLDVINSTDSGLPTNRGTFRCLFLGNSPTLLSLMSNYFPLLGVQKDDLLEISWIKSVLFFHDFPYDSPLDALLKRQPSRIMYLKRKSDYLKNPIPRHGLEGLLKTMVQLEVIVLAFNPYGGRMAEVLPQETAFPHRAGNLFKIEYAVDWREDGDDIAKYYIDLTRKLHAYMTPFVSKNPREAFLNYRDLDLGLNHQGSDNYIEAKNNYGLAYFKDNFDRLVWIKSKVDPLNFFRNEQSIPVMT